MEKRLIANRNNYEIIITETKSRYFKKLAFDSTVRFDSNVSDLKSYLYEHSPLYQEEYLIEMRGIPVFVSTHILRSGPGTYDYILTQRDDRGGEDEGRWTATNHSLFINGKFSNNEFIYRSFEENLFQNLFKDLDRSPTLAGMIYCIRISIKSKLHFLIR